LLWSGNARTSEHFLKRDEIALKQFVDQCGCSLIEGNTSQITQPTLRKHYFSERKFRDTARDRLDPKVGLKL
jgi:hypothetical protein